MSNRLTWNEIVNKYPDMWVVLTDVEYRNNDMVNVISAVVICGVSDEDYPKKRVEFMQAGKNYEYERTSDTRGFIGVTV